MKLEITKAVPMNTAGLKLLILILIVTAALICCPWAFAGDEHGHGHGHRDHEEEGEVEGRTELSPNAVKAAEIGFDVAGPQVIAQSAVVYGQITPNDDHVAHIHPRFPGIVKQINKSLGDTVKSGDVLAVVESNQSLKEYEVRSQLGGVVIERHLTLGEYVAEDQQLFIVADLTQVWADFHVYRDDFSAAAVGREILIDADDGGVAISATVTYVSPVTDTVTQSKRIRAVISNTDGRLRPGIFIKGILRGSESEVPIAVRREALQTFRDGNVVFVTDGHIFQAAPVEVARKDSKYAEILSGITAGQKYVSRNSYIIKADIEKSGASHDH